MTTKVLSVDLLRMDTGTQSRVAINEDVVDDYAEIIKAAGLEWPFPAVDVFHDETDHHVGDGFHRVLGANKAGRASVPCNVHKGTAADAMIFGMTANDRHGMRMTRADKRHCVEWLLDNGGKLTQAEIAEKAGVTSRTVKMVVACRNPASLSGKVTPPKQDGKGQTSPDTPSSGVSEDEAPPDPIDSWEFEEGGTTPDTPVNVDKKGGGGKKSDQPDPPPPVVEISEAEKARHTVGLWVTTLDAMLSKSPTIDEYRKLYPSLQGDKAVKLIADARGALANWKKVIK